MSERNVTLVCGPPCAGKNHHVDQHSSHGDTILDFDAIAQELGSPHKWDHPQELIRPVEMEMRRRMEQVGTMTSGTAWVIRTAPRGRQRERAARIIRATDTVVLVPDLPTLQARAEAERSPRTLLEIDWWMEIYQGEQRQHAQSTTPAPPPRNGSTRASRKLRAQVLNEQPLCQIRTPDICTGISTQADHIIPIALRPDLAMVKANLQGACAPCNRHKGASVAISGSSQPPLALGIFGD